MGAIFSADMGMIVQKKGDVMARRIGERTVGLESVVAVRSFASAVGPKESQGPLAKWFDVCSSDEFFGEESFEKAES